MLPGIRHDANLVLPIRQTASIFKQPVTVVRTRPESRTRSDVKTTSQEQPKQVIMCCSIGVSLICANKEIYYYYYYYIVKQSLKTLMICTLFIT